jgi:hypothetical protein
MSAYGTTRRRHLGAITPAQAIAQGAPDITKAQAAGITNWITQRQILNASGQPAYIPGSGDCAKAQNAGPSNNVKLAQMATGLALTGVNVAVMADATLAAELAAVGITTSVLGAATLGISAIVGIFVLLSAHHAAAVAKEQTVLCSTVPAANNYLEIIQQGVSSGQVTPQEGIAALDSLVTDFSHAVQSIYGKCNAACVMTEGLRSIALELESQYQDLIAAQAAAVASAAAAAAALAASQAQLVTPSRPNTTASGGAVMPASSYSSFYAQGTPAPIVNAPSSGSNWLPIAAAVAVGFLVMRIL